MPRKYFLYVKIYVSFSKQKQALRCQCSMPENAAWELVRLQTNMMIEYQMLNSYIDQKMAYWKKKCKKKIQQCRNRNEDYESHCCQKLVYWQQPSSVVVQPQQSSCILVARTLSYSCRNDTQNTEEIYCKTLNVCVPFILRILHAKQNREIKGREYQLQAKQ